MPFASCSSPSAVINESACLRSSLGFVQTATESCDVGPQVERGRISSRPRKAAFLTYRQRAFVRGFRFAYASRLKKPGTDLMHRRYFSARVTVAWIEL